MKNIPVKLGGRSYNVHIESGAIGNIAEHLRAYAAQDRLLFVTDRTVADLYWPRISEQLVAAGIPSDAFVLEPGEASKNWRNLERICDWLLAHGIERSDHLIALGGGVVGDIAGFASAIVKRGCNFVQIPTTLLAQVDSSVGGKTAINCGIGKNLVGLFHQPGFVLIDPAMLGTLPPRELRAGYAEVVKYGLIDDADFFAWCEENGPALLAGDGAAQIHAIGHSIAAKAKIVAEDELELNGRRALLNLGHTFGHALEAATGFSDTSYCTAKPWRRAWRWQRAIRHGAVFAALTMPPGSSGIYPPADCQPGWPISLCKPTVRGLLRICGMTRKRSRAWCRCYCCTVLAKHSSPTTQTWTTSCSFSTGNWADQMPHGIKKENLPQKMCPVCQRPFAWRKKWERDWDNVVYCSKRCRSDAARVISS